MNSLTKKWVAILWVAIPLLSNAQEKINLYDPSGKVQVTVSIGSNITYSVLHEGDIMIEPSPISITLTDGTIFGKEPRLRKQDIQLITNTIYPPIYKKKSIEDSYNELKLEFKGGYDLIFRAYEDGVAYRFISNLKKPFMI